MSFYRELWVRLKMVETSDVEEFILKKILKPPLKYVPKLDFVFFLIFL